MFLVVLALSLFAPPANCAPAAICPCVTSCPDPGAIYGTHPLDPYFFGTLDHCPDQGRVRCCNKQVFIEVYARHDGLVEQTQEFELLRQNATKDHFSPTEKPEIATKSPQRMKNRQEKQLSPVYVPASPLAAAPEYSGPIACAAREECNRAYGTDVLDILQVSLIFF